MSEYRIVIKLKIYWEDSKEEIERKIEKAIRLEMEHCEVIIVEVREI